MLADKFGENALCVMRILEEAGYGAYAVGGCVRDALLGKLPHDVDITTDALPEQTKSVFKDCKVIETGIAHGTVTVIFNSEPFEITTYRCDGTYEDLRHPSSVEFTSKIEEDLKRRDFTVNSIAMDRRGNIVDVFGGRKDIAASLIRCTGNADERFNEDALRIMRALRFSSVLGFEIEEETAKAIRKNREFLKKVSVERIFTELKKLLVGKDVFRVLCDFPEVICTIIPELSPSVGFDHMSKYHKYDVYTHIAKTVEAAVPDETVRLAMLFHDVGKPYVCTFDGINRHFKGHPEVSEKMAHDVLKRLHADGYTVNTVSLLCKYHDMPIEPSEKSVRRLLLKISYNEARLLCEVRKADAMSHTSFGSDRGKEADVILKILDKLEKENACIQIKDLKVDGNDVVSFGFRGPQIGRVLKILLTKVIDGEISNERSLLIEEIEKISETLLN